MLQAFWALNFPYTRSNTDSLSMAATVAAPCRRHCLPSPTSDQITPAMSALPKSGHHDWPGEKRTLADDEGANVTSVALSQVKSKLGFVAEVVPVA